MKVLSKRKILCFLFAAALCFSVAFFVSACSGGSKAEEQPYIVSFVKTGSDGAEDIYTITYSDGTESQFTVTNGGLSAARSASGYSSEKHVTQKTPAAR